MIYYNIAYDSDKNIGACYNRVMKLLPNDSDWGAFFDSDTMSTTSDFGVLIENAILEYSDAAAFTCYTNRVMCPWQIAPDIDRVSNDMKYHKTFGRNLREKFQHKSVNVTNRSQKWLMSGMFFVLKKEAWKKCGPLPENGMLTIDNHLHLRLRETNQKLYLIKGLYLYHWWRNNGLEGTDHLSSASNEAVAARASAGPAPTSFASSIDANRRQQLWEEKVARRSPKHKKL